MFPFLESDEGASFASLAPGRFHKNPIFTRAPGSHLQFEIITSYQAASFVLLPAEKCDTYGKVLVVMAGGTRQTRFIDDEDRDDELCL